MRQAALTIVVPIEGKKLEKLEKLLGEIQDQVHEGRLEASADVLLPFGDLQTVHFARFAVLYPSRADPTAPPLLIFATCYDGEREAHLRELEKVAGDGLRRVFEHVRKDLSGSNLRTFLDEHSQKVRCDAFYVGHRGLSASQIERERRLHEELNRLLGPFSGQLASDPFAEAQRRVETREDLRWALRPPDPTPLPWYRRKLLLAALPLLFAALPLVLVVVFLLLIPVGVWLLWIRVLEWKDERRARAPQEPDVLQARGDEIRHKAGLRQDEDRSGQNQMTLVTDVKPGLLRLVTLRTVLRAVDLLGRRVWNQGRLGEIQSIHFARWLVVRQGKVRRLVFFSNYDGSWETYVGSFIDGAAAGLTGIWSNTSGFPASRWLFWSGARRELKFKRWVRGTQVETAVWYSAYPDLSVANVQNNSEIRRGLQGLPGLEERQAWLRRL